MFRHKQDCLSGNPNKLGHNFLFELTTYDANIAMDYLFNGLMLRVSIVYE